MTTAYQFTLPLTSEERLREFVQLAFDVTIPDEIVIPGHVSPWRAFADAYFARNRICVWKASRGFGGKSFLLALLGLVEALTLKANVKILGGSGQQSENVQQYIAKEFYNSPHAPRNLWLRPPLTTFSSFVWGNTIQSLYASQTSVRGPHPQRLRMDEIDEMPIEILDAALGQPMSKVDPKTKAITIPAQVVLSSTHQYPNGTMSKILQRAKVNGWPVYEWSYHETSVPTGWLTQSEIEAQRSIVTTAMWNIEYELQEPAPESRAIISDRVKTYFDPRLGEFEGDLGEYIEIEPPQPNGHYTTGADWAKTVDYTVIVTFRTDVYPYKLVAFERRGREPWPRMIQRFDARLQRFGPPAAHDATGIGNVVDDFKTSDAKAIVMQGALRTSLFTDYVAAIENGSFIAPLIKWMYNEHYNCSIDDLYGRGHPPDSIVAGALALRAQRQNSYTGQVNSLAQRKKKLATTAAVPESSYLTLLYTGTRRFPLTIGKTHYMLEPGWQRQIEAELAQDIVAQFPDYFEIIDA